MIQKIDEFFLDDIYTTVLGHHINNRSLIFVHGGPGLNSQPLIEYSLNHGLFDGLKFNLIFYDQRGCGKSKNAKSKICHDVQVHDLFNVYDILSKRYNVAGIIGHSYGAKLLFDFYKKFQIKTNYFFLSTANNIDIPRLNNIKLDLDYLKETNSELYQHFLEELSTRSIWDMTEFLSETFDKNPNRINRYWHNKFIQDQYMQSTQKCPFKLNQDVFNSLRQELYTSDNRLLDYNSIAENWHIMVGYHDYIMSGHLQIQNKHTHVFFKSAHYPHIEENRLFCEVINENIP